MILVTGGTGLVGSHLIYYLLKDGHAVRAIHRKSSNLNAVKKVFSYYTDEAEALFNKIDWTQGDINDIPSLTEAFKGVSTVYHAAALIRFSPKQYFRLKKVNIEGTANIVNLCLENGVQKLCHVSSISTLGQSINDGLINEECHWDPEVDNSVYGITKYGAEMEVWRGTQEGLDAIIVNPSIILGEGFWNSGSGTIIRRVAEKRSRYTTGGVGFVDVHDVVKAMISLTLGPYKNEKYILVGENMFYKEFLSRLAKQFNQPPPKPISQRTLMFWSKLDWVSNKIFGTKRKLRKRTVKSFCKKSFYDSTKIKNELNFSFTPMEETLNRVSKNYSLND